MDDETTPEAPEEEGAPASEPSLRDRFKEKGTGRLTSDIYEEMAQTYFKLKDRTIRGLSRATGMNMETCRKAVVLGWPERDWPSLRERARVHDARIAAQTAMPPLTPGQVLDAKRFQEIRSENLNLARAMRGLGANLADQLRQAVANATAFRHGKRVRVIDVEVGTGKNKRTVQKVVQEDYAYPPYLPHIASAAAGVAQMMFAAGEAERSWSRAPTPEELVADGDGAGWDAMTEEQMDFVIKNNGKLPPGLTAEQIWGRRARKT